MLFSLVIPPKIKKVRSAKRNAPPKVQSAMPRRNLFKYSLEHKERADVLIGIVPPCV